MEGVHPPPPSSFAPRRSRPTVDFFGAPRRLPTRTKFTSTGELRQHPQETCPPQLDEEMGHIVQKLRDGFQVIDTALVYMDSDELRGDRHS